MIGASSRSLPSAGADLKQQTGEERDSTVRFGHDSLSRTSLRERPTNGVKGRNNRRLTHYHNNGYGM